MYIELNKILCGDCVELMKEMPQNSVDLVITSPPYADQRKKQYGGIDEKDYPNWTVKWMSECWRILKDNGSVAIVIRPNIKNGQISDYVLKTRLALREWGWIECEELIWIKPDSPPLGNIERPRRAWESILWFGKSRNVFCNPKENGKISNRIGFVSKKGVGDYKSGISEPETGISRCRDYIEVGTGKSDRSKENTHPAQFPEELSSWIIRLLSPEDGIVLDPFVGSGTSAVSCVKNNRKYIGIDCNLDYCKIAEARILKIKEL